MNVHHGQIIERVIRRNGYSISELARLTKVNRRSVYNWFNQKHLKAEIVYRIGIVLNYDFSQEFPELFPKQITSDFVPPVQLADNPSRPSLQQSEQCIWKDKYIDLLERYNKLLLSCIENNPKAINGKAVAEKVLS
ncbi:helix-turn-helix domain-containing protein [Arcticibacter tournemirensis]|uniref:XRE family transcriptional regulator n=1 Tax=Arcticibacter tournemirensis TaxID=699437 RepID=A0A4Q0M8R2_9SPHI|nr:helix-turn-helix transcriptional regulator [Arcticibacter tournemirensis]RXF69445.1 XRE family transcriptional regulator [Arcticibacter tournemirensis]